MQFVPMVVLRGPRSVMIITLLLEMDVRLIVESSTTAVTEKLIQVRSVIRGRGMGDQELIARAIAKIQRRNALMVQ
jgi:hypothetical protein